MTILHYLTGMASEAAEAADWRLGKFDELTFATNLFLMIVSGAATQLL